MLFGRSLDIPRILELLLGQAAQHPPQSRPQLRRGHPDIRTNSTGGSRRIQENLLEVQAVVVRQLGEAQHQRRVVRVGAVLNNRSFSRPSTRHVDDAMTYFPISPRAERRQIIALFVLR